jgi:Tfp pilus assembly protein PilF
MMKLRGQYLGILVVTSTLAMLSACAKEGAGPDAVTPAASQQQGGAPNAAGGAVTNAQGQQFAVSDAPSSGEAATNRPQMSAGAKQAYQSGMQAFMAGDLQGAKTQFSNAVQADPKAYQAYYSLAVVHERLGATGSATTAYQKAVGVVPDYEPAILGYAVLLARRGKAAEAEDFLRSKLGAYPKSAAISTGLAEVKSIQGNSGEAQRLAQDALKKNPDYRPAMVTLARDHYRNRRLDLALYALKGILDGYGEENPPRDKNNAEAHLLRGLIYREENRRGPAIEEFEEAIKLRPDLVEARVQLATYFMEAGNAAGAVPHLETAIRYDNTHLLAHLSLGDAYRLMGKSKEAKQELEWVAQTDPSLAQPHYNLGLLYLLNPDVPGVTPKQAADKAIEHFEKYKSMKPRSEGPDDTEELINRAKAKKALIDAKSAEASAAQGDAGGAQ